jgi:tetratricopeptide (TPR) repeat protein
MGFALKDGGKPAEAIEYLKKATDLNSNADLSLNELGRIYFDQKDYSSAAGFFQKAIDARPDFANYHNNLAYCFRNLGDRDKTIQNFERAFQLDPTDDVTINDLVVVYFEADRYEDIISLMTDAVKTKPDSAAYYTNLALAYKHTGRNNEAIDSFEQALKLDGADYDNWIDLAGGYLLTNAAEKALEAYEKAIALRPENPVGYANKAIALVQLGNLKEAEELVNGDHLDEATRKDFLSQTRILFPAIQVDEDPKKRLIIQQIKDKV